MKWTDVFKFATSVDKFVIDAFISDKFVVRCNTFFLLKLPFGIFIVCIERFLKEALLASIEFFKLIDPFLTDILGDPFNVDPVLIVQVSAGDWLMVTFVPPINVILFCLLLDNEFKQLLRFDMLFIVRQPSGMDNVVVDTL